MARHRGRGLQLSSSSSLKLIPLSGLQHGPQEDHPRLVQRIVVKVCDGQLVHPYVTGVQYTDESSTEENAG